jgi:endonuclease IV
MIQHVISSEIDQAYEQVKESLEAIKEIGVPTILVHPNSDAGSQQIVKAIHEYENLPFIHIAKKKYEPTAGCIALKKKDLIELLKNIKKNTKIKIR